MHKQLTSGFVLGHQDTSSKHLNVSSNKVSWTTVFRPNYCDSLVLFN